VECPEERREGIRSELGAVKSGWREISEGRGERFRRYRTELGNCFRRHLLCEQRGAGDRSSTAPAQKTRFRDRSIFHAGRKLQNIPTDGIRDLQRGRCVREFAGIPGITKVIEDGVAEHRNQYRSGSPNLQRATPKG